MSRYSLALLILLVVPGLIIAGKVKVWHHARPAHFEKARMQHTVISSEGTICLSRQLKSFANLDASHVWDMVEDQAGNVYVATGNEGKIFRVTPKGEASVAYASDQSQVLCLARTADGTIYAGTGPQAQIVRVSPNGESSVICKLPENYVWSMSYDPKTSLLYAGTGPNGKIYEIQNSGEARIFYSTRQEHVLALACGQGGNVYAGTDKEGLVYRIDRQGKGFVLCSTPQSEVRRLLVTEQGVFASTSAPARRRGSYSGLSNGGRASLTSTASLRNPASKRDDEPTRASTSEKSSGSTTSSGSESSRGSSAPAPSSPSAGENSIYHIGTDGTVREVFREKALLLCLLREADRIFVGTGMDGLLFEVNEITRERTEIARLDHGQIHSMIRRKDGSFLLGTGDPGKLYVLQDKFMASGAVISDVLDAKLPSRWGALSWTAEAPDQTSVTVAARSGNSPEPDETWSPWCAELTESQGIAPPCPPARFLQYRLTLHSNDPKQTPVVHSVAVRYQNTNQAPDITAITVPDLDSASQDNPKRVRLKWTANDANEDELTYSLLVRKDGWKSWVQIEENLDKPEYDWDTTTMPAGMYQIKVVASDRRDNGPEECLTAERISAPFAVAHAAPTVQLKAVGRDGDHTLFEATATDPIVRLTSASFSVDGKKWNNLFPSDGLFDSTTEHFRFKAEAAKPGTHVLVMRVKDSAGNIGSADVVFSVK